MPENNAVTELYNKMLVEQGKYRDWLLDQPPIEILKHAYEYTMREDILLATREADLTDTQAQALLTSPAPLDEIYRLLDKSESYVMENIADCMKSRAEAIVLQQSEEAKNIPVYPHDASFAIAHDELAAFKASHKANVDCRDAIEKGISEHYHDNRLDVSFAKEIVNKFGSERVNAVLASSIRVMDRDGRVSDKNKAWAKGFALPEYFGREYRITQCNPGLIDLFCTEVRKIQQEKKPSILGRLSEPLPKPSAPTAPKSKAQER